MWDVLLLPLLCAAAVGGAGGLAAQRTQRLQGGNDAAGLVGVTANSPGRVLGVGVNWQTGSALLLNPAAAGPGAGGPGLPRPPGALDLLKLGPELLLVLLWPLCNPCEEVGVGVGDI